MLRTKFLSILVFIEISYLCQVVHTQLNRDYGFRYTVGLSEPLQSTLEWDFNEDDEQIIFNWNITLNEGYSGILAFSNYDLQTSKADIIIFGNDEKLYNGYTDEKSILALPDSQIKLDYNVLKRLTIEKGRKTEYTIRIIRPFDTCDEQQRNYIIDRGSVHLLTGSMTRDDYQKFKKRKTVVFDVNRMDLTLQRVQLLKSQVSFAQISNDDPHIDFLNTNILIPDDETTYWCTRFELPDYIMKEPHHIVRFDGVVSPQSDGIVHHMELFHCNVDPGIEIPSYNEKCTSEQKPMGLTPCRRVIGAWALGAANFTYPDEAGGLIGGPKSSRFVVLEVHFNNPYFKKGVIDQSGIRIYYTAKRRRYDAAIMEVGLEYNPKNSVPPGLSTFRVSGYCTSECTQATLPSRGITVFASQLHTHLTGKQTFTRIIRKNGKIVTLNMDRHYSPHFQEIRLLPTPVQIEPGDTILHTCIYNSENREKMTFGGYGINDEMCVNYMHYYPASGLELCKTSVSDSALQQFFQTMKQYDYANTSEKQTIYQNYESIRWTPLTSAILEAFYEIAPIHLSCNGSDGNYSPKFDPTRKYYPYEPEQRDIPIETAAKCE